MGNDIYIGGGYVDNGERNGFMKLTLADSTWTALSDMQEDRFRHSCVPINNINPVINGNGVAAAGGWYGLGEEFQRKSIEFYDVETGMLHLLFSLNKCF